jgi:arabinoxylan arabinofuranohydrolase
MTYRYGADPGVMVYNGRVYVYTTNDGDVDLNNKNVGENSYSHIQSLNCISSADLVNWTDHGSISVAGNNGAAKWDQYSWATCAT